MSVESGLRPDLLDGLREKGHNVTLFDINLGIAEVQAVMRTDGWYYGKQVALVHRIASSRAEAGASDSRKNGVALAY